MRRLEKVNQRKAIQRPQAARLRLPKLRAREWYRFPSCGCLHGSSAENERCLRFFLSIDLSEFNKIVQHVHIGVAKV